MPTSSSTMSTSVSTTSSRRRPRWSSNRQRSSCFPTTPYGPITIGGATDPYNGLIDYIALFDPVTGEPILRFP